MVEPARPSVVCRPIEDSDVPAVVDSLTRGFPERPRDYWTRGLAVMARRPRIADYPRYGHLLEADGRVVGVMLQIFSTRDGADGAEPRCNLSSWYVDEDYRGYAHALHARTISRREVVYLNISAAPHTVPVLKAVGYRRYAEGQIVFAPLLALGAANARVVEFVEGGREAELLSSADRRLLADHAALGCAALIGVRGGEARPLVFQWRVIWRRLIPCVHLIYCREMNDLVVFSAALGRYFAKRGRFVCVADANGPIAGLAGKFFGEREPRYFKGASAPQPCDLAYTELVILGR
ncbi:MAG: hypothetical protein ABSA66_06305 [Roseiarcus sp.]|jgi:hypothetical protein